MEEATKKCTKCGMVKTLSAFGAKKTNADGYHTICKSCINEYQNARYKRVKTKESGHHLIKVYLNPELAKFQPKDLINELRARGYTGELSFKQVIKV